MEYYCCEYIEESICFNDSRILYCTVGNQYNCREMPLLLDNCSNETIDWDNILAKRQKDIELFKREGSPGGAIS